MPAQVTSPPEHSRAYAVETTVPPGNRRDLLVLGILCALVFLLGCLRGAAKPFWYDEIATVHIAAAPTWAETLRLSHTVDLHPPLEPALVRLSFSVFGPHEFAGHLPSVLSFTLAVGSVFLFLRRRCSLVYALFGALLLLCNQDIFDAATEARPYGLLLGAVCVGVLAYDIVLHKKHPVAARLVLALSLVAMLQSHLFGVFAAGAFAFAELVRTLRTRRIDQLTWLVILLPWLSCVTYVPLLRAQAGGPGSPLIYEVKDRSSVRKGLLFYYQSLYVPLAPLIKAVALVLLCLRFFPARSFGRTFKLRGEQLALLGVLLATPILVTLLLAIRAPGSGFFPRYAVAAACPATLLLAGAIAWRAGENPRAGSLLLTFVLIGCAFSFSEIPQAVRAVSHNHLVGPPPGYEQTGGVERLCPTLPLVMDSALQFLESDFRLPANAESRMVYLTDVAESLRLDHQTATQAVAGESSAFHTPHHVLQAGPFLAAHPDFLLMLRPRHPGWLSDLLQERHAAVLPLGHFQFTGASTELWLVTQPGTGPFPVTAACPAH